MKTALQFAVLLLAALAPASAQVAPEATGPFKLPVQGYLNYTVRYSESEDVGSTAGSTAASSVSASASYANGKQRLPFTLTYGGGYNWTSSSGSYDSGLYQNLSLSQGIVGHHWSLTANDSASYSRQAPTTGFSGNPASGEPISGAGSTTPPVQTILTVNTETVNNNATASFSYTLDRATTLNVGGSSSLLRYPGGNAQDTDAMGANAGLSRRLNARNSLSAQFAYARFYYPGSDFSSSPGMAFSAQTESVSASLHRTWNRWLSTGVSAGPERISSSNAGTLPSATSVMASAMANGRFRWGGANLSYFHGVSGGAGFLPGAESDSASANLSRALDRKTSVGLSASYFRSSALTESGVTNGRFAGIQINRSLRRSISIYAGYTAVDQSSSSPLPSNVLGQLYQVVACGIAYSPRATHLNR